MASIDGPLATFRFYEELNDFLPREQRRAGEHATPPLHEEGLG
jgi:hypothetical protein